jgi:hypothetical protein
MDLAHLESFHGATNAKPMFGAPAGTLLLHTIRHDPESPLGLVEFTLTFNPAGWGEAHAPADFDQFLTNNTTVDADRLPTKD